MEVIIYFIIGLSVLIEAFFAGGETAFICCNRLKIKHQARLGKRSAQLIENYLRQPHQLFSTTLTGTNLAIVTGSVLATAQAMAYFGRTRGTLLAIAVMFPLNLVFGELLPKVIFFTYADWLVHLVIWPLRLFDDLFHPLIWLSAKASSQVLKLFGQGGKKPDQPLLGREELRLLLEEDGLLNPLRRQQKKIIDYIFHFKEKRVQQVMIKLAQVVAVEETADLAEVRKKFNDSGRSRLLVYRKRLEMPIGFVEARDILLAPAGATLAQLTKNLYLVADTKPISRLALELREAGQHLALVVSELGAAVGLITYEDIIEEVVGEIIDEFEKK